MEGYRRFTKEDWYGYAGSECFSDGSQPFFYEEQINSEDTGYIIIVDKNGIQVQLVVEGSSADNIWLKDTSTLTALRAEGYMRKLIEYFKKYDNLADLAYELDHPSDEITKGFEFAG